MKKILDKFQPKEFFYWFEEISKIPRESGNEGQIIQFIKNYAINHNYSYDIDEHGNVFINVPATQGFENCRSVLMQAHMDMVCVKEEDIEFDFLNDPIQLRVVDNMIYANGTTLGADNAVGMATMLAIADCNKFPHPELELLFTTEEEIGLKGIRHFDFAKIKSRRMINMDCGYSHIMCVSSAGAIECSINEKFNFSSTDSANKYELLISGGSGGHSGIMIHKGRMCAANIAGEVLYMLSKHVPIRLSKIATADKAILARCDVRFLAPKDFHKQIINIIDKSTKDIINRYNITDPNIHIDIVKINTNELSISETDTKRIINAMYLINTGVYLHDTDDPNIIVTSSAISHVSLISGIFNEKFAIRSMSNTIRNSLYNKYECVIKQIGMTIDVNNCYPGWPYQGLTEYQKIFIDEYKRIFDVEIGIEHIHGGIETGFIVNAIPDMDAVGIAPTATNAHTTNERLEIDKVEPFWDLLKAVFQTKK